MNKLTEERMQVNLQILDILRDAIKERPELRFGQLLYDLGILKSNYNKLVGKPITDDIFNTESIVILNQLKKVISKKEFDNKLDTASTYEFTPNPIKIVRVDNSLDKVEIEPHVRLVFLLLKDDDSLETPNLEDFITDYVSKGIFVTGIVTGDLSSLDLPGRVGWFHVKTYEEVDEIAKCLFQIVGAKGIIDLDIDDVIFSMKGGTPYFASAINEEGDLREAINEVIVKLSRETSWFEPDNVLLLIGYNHVNGEEGLSMKQMEPVNDFVSYCGEYANYRWGLAVMPDLPKGAIKVIAIAS